MRRMRSKYIWPLLVILAVFTQNIVGQEFKDLTFRQRLFFGGDFWIQFGDITDILISPVLGYRVTERLSSGAGIKYEYYRNKFPVDFRTHIWGGRAFSSYTLIKNLNDIIPLGIGFSVVAHAEYEGLNLETRYFRLDAPDNATGRFWLHSLLIGGGVGIPTGERSGASILVLWNVNPNASRLYSNPVIRFGFTF